MTQSQPLPLAQLLSLQGKVAIVSGGALGIGKGIALRLAEAGAAVVIADFNAAAGERAAVELRHAGRKAIAVTCDVSKEVDVVDAVEAASREFGRVDVLVNNAGIYPFKPALQMSAEEWDRVQSVNLRGTFLFCRDFANRLIAQGGGGAIVNIGSVDSLHPSMVGLAAYDASKGGMLMFTKSLALELAPHGIRVNMLAPGIVRTEGSAAAMGAASVDEADAAMSGLASQIPLGRTGLPDDIATVALFLAGPAAAYITGETLVVDGGLLLN